MNSEEYRRHTREFTALARRLTAGELERHFQKLVAARPDDVEAVLGLVTCWWRNWHGAPYTELRRLLVRLARRNGHSAACWFELGLYLELGELKYQGAVRCYKRAIHRDPSFFQAHLGLAWVGISRPHSVVYLSMEEAQWHARRATEAEPDELDGWLALGNANAELGRTEEAIQAWERYLDIPLSTVLAAATNPQRVREAYEETRATVRQQIENVRQGRPYWVVTRLTSEDIAAFPPKVRALLRPEVLGHARRRSEGESEPEGEGT